MIATRYFGLMGMVSLSLQLPTAVLGESAPRAPESVIDIDGRSLDLVRLAHEKRLAFVTIKSPDCPVCLRQLERLKKIMGRLEACNVALVALSPGPTDAVRGLRDRAGLEIPFVEDVGLAIADSLGFRLGRRFIQPGFILFSESRKTIWSQQGRNAGLYGDQSLLEALDCETIAQRGALRRSLFSAREDNL